jgi:hypothetical protein
MAKKINKNQKTITKKIETRHPKTIERRKYTSKKAAEGRV